MTQWQGQTYFDDRLFILDLHPATKNGKAVWAVTTRRNVQGFPPRRVDDFPTRDEAVTYLKKVEPSTPRISLDGMSPSPEPTYDQYVAWCRSQDIPSSMQIHEMNKGDRGRVIIDELQSDVAEKSSE
jgi:hypothetical protein